MENCGPRSTIPVSFLPFFFSFLFSSFFCLKGRWTLKSEFCVASFWDWTTADTLTDGIPDIFREKNIKILYPGKAPQIVVNPLANYPLQGLNEKFPDRLMQHAYFNKWTRTCRCPDFEEVAQDNYTTLNT